MAANPNKISTLNIPSEVIDSDWKDDIDTAYAEEPAINVDYAIYGDSEKQEGEYISPASVSKESIGQIKNFQEKLAFSGLKRFRQAQQQKLAA